VPHTVVTVHAPAGSAEPVGVGVTVAVGVALGTGDALGAGVGHVARRTLAALNACGRSTTYEADHALPVVRVSRLGDSGP
jgi:hypothetical protein